MNNKPSYYGIIPAHVRYCKELKPIARLLYADITALCNANGYCTAKNKYFAEAFELSDRSITRYISELERLNFIWIESITTPLGTLRKIWVDKTVMGRQNCLGGGDRTVYQNNINTNKVSKEPENYINDHDRITKEISSYLQTDAGRQQKAYWLSTTMFSGNFDEAMSSFIDWYYGKDDMAFINNPLRFLNKKMVYWLRNKKTSAYAKDKAPNKTTKPQTLESFYDECKKTVNQKRALLKIHKDKYQAFLKSATIKQTVFEYIILNAFPFESSEYTRKGIFRMFMKDLTEWQKNNFTNKQMMEKFKKFRTIKNFR